MAYTKQFLASNYYIHTDVGTVIYTGMQRDICVILGIAADVSDRVMA